MSTLTEISPAFRAQNRASPWKHQERDRSIRLQIGAFVSYFQRGGLQGIPTRIWAVTIGGNGRQEISRVFTEITAMSWDAPIFTITGEPADNGEPTLTLSGIAEFRYFLESK